MSVHEYKMPKIKLQTNWCNLWLWQCNSNYSKNNYSKNNSNSNRKRNRNRNINMNNTKQLKKGMKKEQSWWWKRKGFGRLYCMHKQDCDFAFMLNEHSCENCYFVSHREMRVYVYDVYMCTMYIWVRCIPISAFSCYLSCKIVSILSLISKYEWFKNKNVTICG